jgi:hypothetical protein
MSSKNNLIRCHEMTPRKVVVVHIRLNGLIIYNGRRMIVVKRPLYPALSSSEILHQAYSFSLPPSAERLCLQDI